jgi:hypothetical protein
VAVLAHPISWAQWFLDFLLKLVFNPIIQGMFYGSGYLVGMIIVRKYALIPMRIYNRKI